MTQARRGNFEDLRLPNFGTAQGRSQQGAGIADTRQAFHQFQYGSGVGDARRGEIGNR